MTPETTFTPSEAAVVSGVPIRVVHKAIDDGPLESARSRKSHHRTLKQADLLYLAAARVFDRKLVRLTDKARERFRREIAAFCRTQKSLGRLMLFNGLELDIQPILSKVRSRAALLDRARKMVTTNPRIRAGEPMIRDTRIGVYEIAAMVAGASEKEIEEILAGYPTLRREHLDLARIYAAARPRRGRPPQHPWHTGAAGSR